jgi:ribosome-associated protein
MDFTIEGEYIELIALLKATGIAETGGQAKQMVKEGVVRLNGAVELRKRAKLRVGDCVEVGDVKIVMN